MHQDEREREPEKQVDTNQYTELSDKEVYMSKIEKTMGRQKKRILKFSQEERGRRKKRTKRFWEESRKKRNHNRSCPWSYIVCDG